MTRILVVDDEQDLCEILRFNLTNEGFDVTTANSAEEALELMENTHSGAWGLILLDVMMDRMSGFDMARHLRQHGDNTPIIFLTASDSHGNYGGSRVALCGSRYFDAHEWKSHRRCFGRCCDWC